MAARLLRGRSNASQPSSARAPTIPFRASMWHRFVQAQNATQDTWMAHPDTAHQAIARPRCDLSHAIGGKDLVTSNGYSTPCIMSYATFGLWKIGWVGGCCCVLACENTYGRTFEAALISARSPTCLRFLSWCECSSTGQLPIEFPENSSGWSSCQAGLGGDMCAQQLAALQRLRVGGVHVQNSNSSPPLG